MDYGTTTIELDFSDSPDIEVKECTQCGDEFPALTDIVAACSDCRDEPPAAQLRPLMEYGPHSEGVF